MKLEGITELPRSVYFTYPDKKKHEVGRVVKEVGEIYKTSHHGIYYFVIQLIEYDDEDDKYIRFGYYRKKPKGKKFVWGSQTTFHVDKDFTNKLIKKAQNEGIL